MIRKRRWWAGLAATALALAGTVAALGTTGTAAAAATPTTGFYGWGPNGRGGVGDGTTTQRLVPTLYAGPSQVFTQLAVDEHTLGVAQDGTVWGWGDNETDQVLGPVFNSPENRLTPIQIPGLTSVRQVAVTVYSSLALTQDGSVYVWGEEIGYDLLHDPLGGRIGSPSKVSQLSGITQIAADGIHALALRSDGAVFAWGTNPSGELGTGDTSVRMDPTRVNGLPPVTAIGTGLHHSLAAGADGSLWAWGDNSSGQLGVGSQAPGGTQVPIRVTGLPSGPTVKQLGGGFSHSVARLSDGSLWAWGDNTYGQLGTGNQLNTNAPVRVSGTVSAGSLSVGATANAVVSTSGLAYVWGDNRFGQLGDGTMTPRFTPTLVPGFDHVTAASTGLFGSGLAVGTLVAVPSAIAMSEGTARAALSAAGLVVGRVSYVLNPAPAGMVIAQSPAQGTVVSLGTAVDLTVSSGSSTVPNVLSWDQTSAVNAIHAANLVVAPLKHLNNCVDPGSVAIETPQGGTVVTPGTSVTLTITTCTGGGPVHPQ